jgi:hypothetical protein
MAFEGFLGLPAQMDLDAAVGQELLPVGHVKSGIFGIGFCKSWKYTAHPWACSSFVLSFVLQQQPNPKSVGHAHFQAENHSTPTPGRTRDQGV